MIEQNNKIIAQFLDRNYDEDLKIIWENLYETGKRNPELMENPNNYQYFHNDWNLVIELVRVCKEKQFFGTQHLIDNIDEALMQLNIEDVYQECLYFIDEWFEGYIK